jgi:hypothetical protein
VNERERLREETEKEKRQSEIQLIFEILSVAGRKIRREMTGYVLIMWQGEGMAKQRDKT